MKLLPILSLGWKQVVRHRVRSLLTVTGVAAGMFLYASVQTMQVSLAASVESNADDNTLVVYRENRFCPMTSRLPEYYLSEIRRIDGVAEAIPIQIRVNNCGASLDVITFRGVPPTDLVAYNPELEIVAGSIDQWQARGDAALVGEVLAKRRSLRPGDTFEAVGVRVEVAGIVRSDQPQDNNVAYVHLPFLQQASQVGLGTVTQFNVRVNDPREMERVGAEIDALFASDAAPTTTRPEKAFFAQTAQDMIGLIEFTRWIGLGAVIAVLGLVANALLLAARGRVQESAILQTVGFSRLAVGSILLAEGALLGLIGGAIGTLGAGAFFEMRGLTFGNEGLTLAILPTDGVLVSGMAIAVVLGLVASIWPAFLAAGRPLVNALR